MPKKKKVKKVKKAKKVKLPKKAKSNLKLSDKKSTIPGPDEKPVSFSFSRFAPCKKAHCKLHSSDT